MEGVIGIVAPLAMVVAIVWVVQNGKLRRAQLATGRTREDDVVAASMQQQIDKLTDRVAVLERLVTDDDRRLSREIDRLRERPPA